MRLLPLILLLLLAGCGDAPEGPEPPSGNGSGDLVVVTTTTQVTDIARNVMCRPRDGASCAFGPRGILEGSADPHDYELRPDDVESLADATLVVRSGGEVDEWLEEAIESSGTEAPVVDVLAAVGGDDPHWWTDPLAARRAAEAIRDALVKARPDDGGVFRAATSEYLDDLAELDRATRGCIEKVPAAQRKVVTTHDALGPFARRYGIEVVGTVIPSRSSQGQASSRQVAKLVEDIRAAGATAVFSEAFVSRDVERAIAEQAGARLGPPLRLDTLGRDDSYISATAKNVAALVEGMSGGKVECSPPA